MLSLAVTATVITKLAFFGWGIGVALFDFTGISGHTLLSMAVLPVLFTLLQKQNQKRLKLAGTFFGLLIGTVVSASRVVIGVHSISEVVIAWLLGVAVVAMTLNTLQLPFQRRRFVFLAPLVLLLAFSTPTSSYMPTHDWEVKIALLLSGRDKPYTRRDLIDPSDNKGRIGA